MKASELFDNWIFLNDICDHLSIVLVELPSVLSVVDVCEALLHVKYGPWIICRLVANLPDSFTEGNQSPVHKQLQFVSLSGGVFF